MQVNRKAFFVIVATLVFAPLAFGSVEQWSIAAVELLICLAALFLARQGKGSDTFLLKPPGMLPLILLSLWMMLQVIPLPPAIIGAVAPSVHNIYKPVLDVSDPDRWISLSVNREATLHEWLRITGYGLFYFLVVQVLRDGVYLKKAVRIVACLAIGIAFLAVIQAFSSPDRIYWFRVVPANAQPVGPWVYHNHFAGFVEMTFPLVFALFLFYRPVIDGDKPLRSRIAAMFSAPGSNFHFFLGFGAVIMAAAMVMSLSRGGIISLSLALILFLILLPGRISSFRPVTYGVIASCMVLLITWLGWGTLLDKFGSTFSATGGVADIRLNLWEDSLEIVKDFFLTGTGFGTFMDIYPAYSSLSVDFILDHAHNDYIELLTDGGIPGFMLAGWFVLAVLRQGWQRIRARRERYAVLLAIAAFTGLVSLLFHGMTDFNMHNGANGLYFFFLCGLLVSAGNTRIYYRTRPTLLEKAGPGAKGLLVSAAVLFGCAVIILQGGSMAGKYVYAPVAKTYLNQNLNRQKLQAVAAAAKEAAAFDPFSARYVFALGNARVFQRQEESALASFEKAALMNPLSGIYLQRLALMLTSTDRPAAERLMAIAYDRALNKEALVLTWAEWLLAMGEREKAAAVLKEVFAAKPDLVLRFMPNMSGYAFSREEMTGILPKSASAWAHYGEFLEQQGRVEEAEFFRKHALDFVGRESVIKPWYYNQLYDFYKRHNRDEEAFVILREASEKVPEYAKFHVYLGDRYLREGIFYRARKEYEQALLLDPADMETREKLEELR